MATTKSPIHRDEIDLVELLGVILRWRKAIIITVLSITVLTVLALSIKEHYRFNPKYFGEVKQDVLFATNNFYDKKTDLNKYKKFITTVLFPASINTPKFEINVSSGSNLYYLFETENDMNLFTNRYNTFSDTLYGLLVSRNNLSSVLVENCKMLFSKNIQFTGPKDISLFFDDTSDIKKCKEYNHYINVAQDHFTYAFGNTIEIGDTYMDFLSNFMNSSPELNKINISFNIKKVIKYSIVAFMVSIILGIFFAFILEFWSVNKKRIFGYLK